MKLRRNANVSRLNLTEGLDCTAHLPTFQYATSGVCIVNSKNIEHKYYVTCTVND